MAAAVALKGKIAQIDLEGGRIQTRSVSPELRTAFLGGRGVGGYLQYIAGQMQPGRTEKIGSLRIDAGLLSGTPAPAADRVMITARSFSNRFAATHLLEGFFGPELRFAGFDHLIIGGRAPQPVYLWLKDGRIEIRDAAEMHHDDPAQVRQRIRVKLMEEDAQVLAMMSDGPTRIHESAANSSVRPPQAGGLASAMDALNLIAIAVRGTRAIAIADPEDAVEVLQHIMRRRLAPADNGPDLGAAEKIKWLEDRMQTVVAGESAGRVLDALGIAQRVLPYPRDPEQWRAVCKLFRSVTGLKYSEGDLLGAGERMTNIERLINLKAGYRRQDEPGHNPLLGYERLFDKNGVMRREPADRLLDRVLDAYYAVHGWDQQGRPTRPTLRRLGLERDLKI